MENLSRTSPSGLSTGFRLEEKSGVGPSGVVDAPEDPWKRSRFLALKLTFRFGK